MDDLDRLQSRYACPGVMMGDFNAGYDSLTVQSAFQRGWLHAHDTATEYADEGNGHHPCDDHGFQPYVPRSFRFSLDQIMHRGAQEGFVRRFDRYADPDYMALSDHLPVWADVSL